MLLKLQSLEIITFYALISFCHAPIQHPSWICDACTLPRASPKEYARSVKFLTISTSHEHYLSQFIINNFTLININLLYFIKFDHLTITDGALSNRSFHDSNHSQMHVSYNFEKNLL